MYNRFYFDKSTYLELMYMFSPFRYKMLKQSFLNLYLPFDFEMCGIYVLQVNYLSFISSEINV